MRSRTFLPLRTRGFTLIELMVTVTLLSILIALAFPAMSGWLRNSQVRTASDTLQNGLRLAQAEALRRSRQTVFSLTNSATPQGGFTAVADGRNWSVNTVELMTADAEFLESGVLAASAPDARVQGPAAVCFNALGRVTANAAPGVGGAACTATAAAYNITATGADRPLRVLVQLGGQVRLCDPNRTLSDTTPEGCPP